MKKLKRILKKIPIGVKSSVVFLLATVLSRGLAIITTPIFTRMMSVEQIGTVNLYSSWYSLITVVSTLSLTSGGFSVGLQEFRNERDAYVSSILSLTSITAVLISIVYLLNPVFWNAITGLPTCLMVLMLVGLFLAPARDFWLSRQRFEYKYKLAAVAIIGSGVVASLISIVVVLWMNSCCQQYAAEGRLFANYLILYGVALIIWISIMKKGKTFISKRFWRFSLNLSIPLIGYSIASQILSVSDRIMIGKMIGNYEVGVYGVLYTVSSLSLMVWSALNASFEPYLYQNINEKVHRIRQISFLLLGLYSAIAIMMVYMAPEIVAILATDEYAEGMYIMPPIAAGVFFTAISNLYSDILVAFRKTKYIMYSAITAAALNLVLNYFMLPIFGYMSAAYTTFISYIVMAVLLWFFAYQVGKNQNVDIGTIYWNKRFCMVSVVTIAFCMAGQYLYKVVMLRYVVIVLLGFIVIAFGWMYAKRIKR